MVNYEQPRGIPDRAIEEQRSTPRFPHLPSLRKAASCGVVNIMRSGKKSN
jgi:hypothetical protein